MLQHITDAIFPLKFTDHLTQSDADRYPQTNVVSDFETACMCLTGSITPHCSLSAGEVGTCMNSVYQTLLPPPPHKSLGTMPNLKIGIISRMYYK